MKLIPSKLDEVKLKFILTELGKSVKQEKSIDYKIGYMDGVMDFFNQSCKILKEK